MTNEQLVEARLKTLPDWAQLDAALAGMERCANEGRPALYPVYARALAGSIQDDLTRAIKFVEENKHDLSS